MKELMKHPKKLLKLSMIAFAVLLVAGLAVMLLGAQVAGIVLISAGVFVLLVMATVFWRCPYCDEMLPVSAAFGKKSCPYCGKEID